MNRKLKLPTIIAILILVFGVAGGVILIQSRQIFRIGATPEAAPKGVRITNSEDQKFTVSWITDKATAGFLSWGTTNSLGQTAQPDETGTTSVHSVTVNGLAADTTYFFKINSDGTEFDNSGIPWETKTGLALANQPTSKLISGSVLTAAGQPAQKVLVYVTLPTAAPLSTVTSDTGTWVINLGVARTTDLTSYLAVSDTAQVDILVQAGQSGIASAQALVGSANPVPPMILGQTYDFRNQGQNNTNEVPESQLDLPEESTASGFNLGDGTSTSSAQTVTLDSVKQGETITTTSPEFFGKGPAGAKITVTVQSDPITGEVSVDASGNWDWTPSSDLPPGEHSITINWRDANGILRTLTRNFVVQAAEGPAFEATPSATPRSSPSPTATASASPSATPRITYPATEAAVPKSGNLTPTLVLFIMGISLVTASFVIWKKSNA